MYGDQPSAVDSGVAGLHTFVGACFSQSPQVIPGVRITDACSLLKPFEESGESSAEDGGGGGARGGRLGRHWSRSRRAKALENQQEKSRTARYGRILPLGAPSSERRFRAAGDQVGC